MAPARDFGYHRDGDRLLAHLDVAWNQVNEAVVGLHEDVLKRKAVPWARVRFDGTLRAGPSSRDASGLSGSR